MMKLRYIPNAITILRILLVVAFIGVFIGEQYRFAWYLFTVAALTDSLDGFLARRYAWTSRLGSLLDPLADKFMLLSAFIALAYLGRIPHELLAIIIWRDLVIVIAVIILRKLYGPMTMEPKWTSKLNTGCQVTLVFASLFELSFLALPTWLMDGLMIVVFITTLLSFFHYAWAWGRKVSHFKRGS